MNRVREKMGKYKWFWFVMLIVIVLFAAAIIIFVLQKVEERKQVEKLRERVLLVSFDDYGEAGWRSIFDLLDRYDAKVTFFVNAVTPTDFCKEAVEKGHEIGFHTKNHVNMTEQQ